MFQATRRWFRRNRTPIAIGVGVVGAGYVVTQYVIGKINDARERMGSDRIAKENLRRRFEQNQEDCTYTVLALLPTATKNIVEAMNTEAITFEIQKMKGAKAGAGSAAAAAVTSPPSITETNLTDEDGKSLAGTSTSLLSDSGVHASQVSIPGPASPDGAPDAAAQKSRKTKRQLWDELTINSITRSFTLIYTLALLTVLTRIQLNLLGRRSYLSSVVTLATGSASQTISLENNDDITPEQVYNADFEVNRRYLAFSWWLLHRGWADLRRRVEEAVRQSFGHLSPRDLLTFEGFADLTMKVRRTVEGSTTEERYKTKWLTYLLPPRELEEEVIRESRIMDGQQRETVEEGMMPPLSRRLLDETADIIESPACSHVLSQLLDAGFSWLVDTQLAAGAFEVEQGQTQQIELAHRAAVPLPKILSVLTRQAHAIGDGQSNDYLKEMESVPDLEAFAAVVYSSNWEADVRDDGLREPEGLGKGKQSPVARSVLEESQVSGTIGSDAIGESLVVVDPVPVDDSQDSLESAWEKATAANT